MADTTLHVALTGEQMNFLALVGWSMQFISRSNETGLELAARLMSLLKSDGANATYAGMPVTSIVGSAAGNDTMDAAGAENILGLYPYLPLHDSKGYAVLWLFFAALSFVMVVLRFYIRGFLSGGLKMQDWLILASWGLAGTYVINDAVLVFQNDVTRHTWQVRGEDIRLHWRGKTYGLILFFTASAMYKTALIVFYMELSPSKLYRRAAYTLIGIVWVYTALSEAWVANWCGPWGYWKHVNPFEVGLHCMSFSKSNAFMTSSFVGDLVLDLAVLALPMCVVHGLQLRTKDKVLVYSLICLGCAVCICAAARIALIRGYLSSHDETRKSLIICTWTLIEVHLGVACASAPMLRRCFLQVFPILKSTASRLTGSRSKSSKVLSGASSSGNGTRDGDKTSNNKKQRSFPFMSAGTTAHGGADSRADMTVVSDTTTVASRNGSLAGSRAGSDPEKMNGTFVTTTVTQTEEMIATNGGATTLRYDEERAETRGGVYTSVGAGPERRM